MVSSGGGVALSTSSASSIAHRCAFPISDEQLREMSAAFISDGLTADEQVIYYEDHTADAVLERLADDEVAVDGAIARGQLTIVPTEQTRAVMSGPVAGIRAAVRANIDDALAWGYRGSRVLGEASHALHRGDGVSHADFDLGLAAEIAGRPASILCLYDRRRFPDTLIDEMRAIHAHDVTAPAVYDDALLRITRTGLGGARLAGEADHSNRGMIDRLLSAILDEALRSHSAPTAVTVDMSSLRFLDVAGAASVIRAAEQFPSTHRLVLRGVRPRVQRLLDRCGAPFAPQLDVIARRDPHDEAGAGPGVRAS